ncbi:amidohydrolase family protein [Streptosporangium sp. NBC_01639]|uniref:amidohydrolase family protein n=1 Tax=Streptosporangium sp. NBC_01639 TaxID=2975948 RepID=UPI003864B9DB|nr:amidohydrolase family protein [Streptosporangium sp. NBC_01639]
MSSRGHVLIDADAMLGRHPARDVGAGTVAEALAGMDRFGISEALVGHMLSWLHDPRTGNRALLELVAGQPRLHPCWVMLPDTCGEMGTPAEFVTAALEGGVRAVRAYPVDHGYDLAGVDAAPVLDAVAEAGLPLLLDAAQTTWPQVEAISAARPHLAIVVGGLGYRVLRQAAGVLARTENVHLGLANLSSHCGLEWLVERFGEKRLVFGTGAPTRDPAEAVTRLLWSELGDGAVAAIGAGNLRSLLREKARVA